MSNAFENVTASAKANLVDTVPMATDSRPDREFLPEKIAVDYRPAPDGWTLSSIWIEGHAVLKSGEIGKSRRGAYYAEGLGGRPGNLYKCPAWAREFADAHCPTDGAR